MPWSQKQESAIYLRIAREKGEGAAKRFMRAHGYGKKKKLKKKS
jgi:hypothetical protein